MISKLIVDDISSRALEKIYSYDNHLENTLKCGVEWKRNYTIQAINSKSFISIFAINM